MVVGKIFPLEGINFTTSKACVMILMNRRSWEINPRNTIPSHYNQNHKP